MQQPEHTALFSKLRIKLETSTALTNSNSPYLLPSLNVSCRESSLPSCMTVTEQNLAVHLSVLFTL